MYFIAEFNFPISHYVLQMQRGASKQKIFVVGFSESDYCISIFD